MKAGLYKDDLVRVIDVDYSSKRATIEARAGICTCVLLLTSHVNAVRMTADACLTIAAGGAAAGLRQPERTQAGVWPHQVGHPPAA